MPKVLTIASAALTAKEARRADLERLVRESLARGRLECVRIGKALDEIISQQLYRSTHVRFEDYSNECLGISDSLARKWAQAYSVARTLATADGEIDAIYWAGVAGFNEAHARELKNLDPTEQAAAWTEVKQSAPSVTAAKLAEVAQRFRDEAAGVGDMTKDEELTYLIERGTAEAEAVTGGKRIEAARIARKALRRAVKALSAPRLGDAFAIGRRSADGGIVGLLRVAIEEVGKVADEEASE